MQQIFRTKLIFSALAALAVPASANAQAAPAAAIAQPAVLQAHDDIARFYTASNNAPIWFRSGQAEAGPTLVNILRRAPIDGFSRGPQLASDVEAALAKAQTGDPAAVQAAERVLSAAWIAYVQALHAPTPGMLYGEKWVTPSAPSSFAVLRKALHAPSLAQHLTKESEINPIYGALRDAAIKEAALPNGGNAARYAANLERARSIPATGKFVLVDAATARLWMYENGRPVDSMKVVVGKPNKQTPAYAGYIRSAYTNPYWNVPDDMVSSIIARNVLSQGFGYLKRQGYEVLSGWEEDARLLDPMKVDWAAVRRGDEMVHVRQKPGPRNSMGTIKYEFPNPYGIYLHDTPERESLEQDDRQLSAGCIRLEDAKKLGEWLMGEPIEVVGDAPEQKLVLPEPVPVYVVYLTARAEGDRVAVRPDPYARDRTALATVALKSE